MSAIYRRSFDEPDEVIEVEGVRSELISIGGMSLAHDTHYPGWHWVEHVGPLVGTDWCESHHMSFAIKGQMHIEFRDGSGVDCKPGDVMDIPPGHDAWVVGDEPFETLSFMGGATWLTPLQTLKERILVTLLFTDIVDSTGAARRLGDRRWAELIGSHDQRMAGTVDRHRGRVAKLTGDGVLAIFDGAARAITCAMACRQDARDLGLEIRAAVHTGEVEMAGEEIHGLAVHEASRIMSHAAAGEVLVSDLTKTFARGTHLAFEEHGTVELRGMGEPLLLHRVTDGLRSSVATSEPERDGM
jgi:class 3 adenylate cyclase